MKFISELWNNNVLMSVFMYDFRPRDVNPEQYDQKMQFWKDMIINYCGMKS